MSNSLLGKAKEKKEQKLLEKREKYYRSEILPEIRKIVQGEFVTSKIGVVDKIDEKKCELNKEDLADICGKLITASSKFKKVADSFDDAVREYLQNNDIIQESYSVHIKEKKDSKEFIYNGNLYFLDVFKVLHQKYEEAKLVEVNRKRFAALDKGALVVEINKVLKSIQACENVLMPSMILTPQLTLEFICFLKQ